MEMKTRRIVEAVTAALQAAEWMGKEKIVRMKHLTSAETEMAERVFRLLLLEVAGDLPEKVGEILQDRKVVND